MATRAFCLKCGDYREMRDEKVVEVRAKGGGKRKAAQGRCPQCDSKMFKFLPKGP